MPGEALGEADVLRRPVEVGACTVTKRMDVQVDGGACTLLPDVDEASELARREAPSSPADEEGGVGRDALATSPLPADEVLELPPQELGEENHLERRVGCAALEDAQSNAATCAAVGVEDVRDVEGEQFVGA